jgi:hypothetical protein
VYVGWGEMDGGGAWDHWITKKTQQEENLFLVSFSVPMSLRMERRRRWGREVLTPSSATFRKSSRCFENASRTCPRERIFCLNQRVRGGNQQEV